jgi:chromosome partitioning protein
MARVIAIANQKGGVAKTTTAVTLAAALVERGKSTLVIDLDAQACATFSLGIDPEDLGNRQSIAVLLAGADADLHVEAMRSAVRLTDDGVHLIPATMDVASADVELAQRSERERILARAVEELRSDFDFILIDCSPSLGLMTINALVAADEVLVPLKCETLSHRGLGQLMETIDDVRRWANPELTVAGLIPTLFDGRTAHAQAVLADLQPRYQVPVFEPIPRSIRFAEAPAVGRSVLATSPRSAGARAYRQLAQALLA